MGVGDDDRIANEQRRVRLRSSIARACELLASAVLSNADNTLVRERYTSGALSERALFSLVWQCVATAALFAWTDARPAQKLAPSSAAHGRWSAFLQRVRQAHTGASRAEMRSFEGVFVSSSLANELEDWSVSAEAAASVFDAIELEFRQSTPRKWRSIDSIDLLAELDFVRAWRPVVRADPWSMLLVEEPARMLVASDSVREFSVQAAFGRIEGDSGPISDEPASLLVVDPACGSGAMLVTAARALARRASNRREDARDADTQWSLASMLAERVRGLDKDPVCVALARVGLWLEAPEHLRAAELCQCVRTLDDRASRSSLAERRDGARWLLLTDARSDARELIAHCARLLVLGDWLCALLDPSVPWSRQSVALRRGLCEAFDVDLPAVETSGAALGVSSVSLVLVGRRSFGRAVVGAGRWRTTFVAVSDEERALLEHLERFSTLEELLDDDEPLDERNAGGRRVICLWRAKGQLVAAGAAAAKDPDAVKLYGTRRAPMTPAMLAWLSASVVRWQFATLTRVRQRTLAPLTVEDVFELVSPELASPKEWRTLHQLGEQLERDGASPHLLAHIDDVVHNALSLDISQRAVIYAWRRAARSSAPAAESRPSESAPDREPTPPAPVAPSAGRDEALPRTLGSSQRGPIAPSVDAGDAARGRGAEGALRGRASDGRAALVASARRVQQPEDEAEREAYAIACAAGSEGIPVDELVRRGREHTEDELREAISSLAKRGWVSVSDDERPRVLSAKAAIAKRAR
ncbi:MAG: hypothetical protein U0269_34380 [Polyangiales bacterium]